MRIRNIIFILLIFHFCPVIATSLTPTADPVLAITYSLLGGRSRLGDSLLCYLHAKWLAYKYKLPFFYQPFPYSDKMMLHYQEPHLKDWKNKFLHEIKFNNKLNLRSLPASTLVIVPYFTESLPHRQIRSRYHSLYFAVDWKEPGFRKIINNMIRPNPPLPLIYPPKDKVSVAIHFRDGGDFDSPKIKKRYVVKFVPLDFYFSGLQSILEKYSKKQFYAYIFTDAVNPKKIEHSFRNRFKQYNNIEFDSIPTNANQDQVLIDFFSMLNFDCLIRGDSNLSTVVSKLKDFKILVTPKFVVKNKEITIEGIKIEENSEL